jgi:poly(3-hydroxyalkanoate) synthetase
MICKYEYKDNILFQIFPETLSGNDFCLLNDELKIIENKYSVVSNYVANLQNLKSYNGKFNSIYEFAQKRIEQKSNNKILSAFLVSNDFQMGFARVFQILIDNPQISIKIFTDEAKANEWIKSEEPHSNQQLKPPENALYSYQ